MNEEFYALMIELCLRVTESRIRMQLVYLEGNLRKFKGRTEESMTGKGEEPIKGALMCGSSLGTSGAQSLWRSSLKPYSTCLRIVLLRARKLVLLSTDFCTSLFEVCPWKHYIFGISELPCRANSHGVGESPWVAKEIGLTLEAGRCQCAQ